MRRFRGRKTACVLAGTLLAVAVLTGCGAPAVVAPKPLAPAAPARDAVNAVNGQTGDTQQQVDGLTGGK